MSKLDFQDVLILPKASTVNSRAEIDYKRQLISRKGQNFGAYLPIIAANMDFIGTLPVLQIFAKYDALVAVTKTIERRELLQDEWLEHKKNAIVTLGLNEDFGVIDELMSQYDKLCIDVANGYTSAFADQVERVRARYPDAYLIAGNVATAEGTERLQQLGVDCIKVGIGSGAACITRQVAGVGYPQLSAILDIMQDGTAQGTSYSLCSDGGCIVAADVVKALAAGAQFVMLGGMLAGYDETGHIFYGMSSEKANNKHFGGLQGYRASEGRELYVKRNGSVAQVLDTIRGGITSACAYVGAKDLPSLPQNVSFIEVRRQLNDSLVAH